jgi:hypothetical protein
MNDSKVTVRNQLHIHQGIKVRRETAEVMCKLVPQLYIVEDKAEIYMKVGKVIQNAS